MSTIELSRGQQSGSDGETGFSAGSCIGVGRDRHENVRISDLFEQDNKHLYRLVIPLSLRDKLWRNEVASLVL